jgi:hypothetical protein
VRATPEYTGGWARAVDVIRWMLVAVLTLDLLAGLVAMPRTSSLAGLRQDLQAGRVRSVTFVEGTELRAMRLVRGGLIRDRSTSIVLWRTGALTYRTAPMDAAGDGSGTGQDDTTAAVRTRVAAEAHSAGVPVRSDPGVDLLLRWPQTAFLVFLVVLLTMLRAGQPRRATRWATFWLLLLPLNAGLILTLVREAPWSSRARAMPEPLPHRMEPNDRRTTGGHALLLMLIASALVSTLADAFTRR